MSKSNKAITDIVFEQLRKYQTPPPVTPDNPSELLQEYAHVAQTVHHVTDGCMAKAKEIISKEIACTETQSKFKEILMTLSCATATVAILKVLISQQVATELTNEIDNVDLSDLDKAS